LSNFNRNLILILHAVFRMTAKRFAHTQAQATCAVSSLIVVVLVDSTVLMPKLISVHWTTERSSSTCINWV